MSKKLNTKDLIEKIEKITKSRIASQDVVPLDKFRETVKKDEPKRILVIDDDESIRQSLKRIIESEGHQVVMASQANELSDVFDDAAVDLILLDIGLPWINGFELAELFKEHKDLKSIPIVFVSGQASQEDMKQAFLVGAHDYIKKPFDIEKLKKTIKVLLKITSG